MTNQIDRDAYTKSDGVKVPIDYVRGTNAIPIVIHFRDFEIPSGATAQVFVHKPSGMAVYNSATISGNDVTVDVTTQMFAEVGYNKMQIQISQEEKDLVSFVQPVNVQENYTDGEADESQNESNFFDEYIGKINEAIDDAETATEGANTAAQSANEAAGAANEAATAATTAAGTANTAAQSANEAAAAANEAAGEATTAAGTANTAAQSANAATQSANAATAAANEAAGEATTAAGTANTAAQSANAATQSANAATAAANEAAGEATTAAGTANKAAQSANTATNAASQAAQSANSAATAANQAAQEIEEKAENGDFSATVAIGNVTTGQPGSKATVKNTGTAQNAVFDFSIPKGETGEVENIDTVQVAFTQAASRQNIASGETFATLFGKIAKWFADIRTAAFQGVSNALTQTSAGYVLDARQGKALNDAKLDKKAVANNLTTTAAGYALDARQGKALNDAKLNKTSVVNNLTATAAGYALDARQGKTLNDKIAQTNADLAAVSYSLTRGILGGLASRKYYLKMYDDGTFELVGNLHASKVRLQYSQSADVYFTILTTPLPAELTVDLDEVYAFSGSVESAGIYHLTLNGLSENSMNVYLSANAYSSEIALIESGFTLKGFWK